MILQKIFTHTKKKAINEILKKKGTIVNFLYFASLYRFIIKEKNQEYYSALENGHLILPDGIALKLLLKKLGINIKENLNGTDFTPYFLEQIKGKKIHLAFFTVYDEKIGKSIKDVEKVEKYIKKTFNPTKIFKQVNHYKDKGEKFNFEEYQKSLDGNFDYKILLVGIGSPYQEIWANKHKEFWEKNNIIVLNIGGLFDFWIGFEKRAPKIVRKLNGEWLWRFLQNPKKNYKKVINSLALLKLLISKKENLIKKFNYEKNKSYGIYKK